MFARKYIGKSNWSVHLQMRECFRKGHMSPHVSSLSTYGLCKKIPKDRHLVVHATIPAFGRLRQEDCVCKVHLDYITRFCHKTYIQRWIPASLMLGQDPQLSRWEAYCVKLSQTWSLYFLHLLELPPSLTFSYLWCTERPHKNTMKFSCAMY